MPPGTVFGLASPPCARQFPATSFSSNSSSRRIAHGCRPNADRPMNRMSDAQASLPPDPGAHETYCDDLIRSILKSVKRIAIVGASDNPARPSYFVFKYLSERGYDVIPVNPARVGSALIGKPFLSSILEIEGAVDMVEIFRNSEAALPVVEEALKLDPLPKVIWMQLGVRHDAAAALAEAKGVTVIMNRCPKIEYGRLSGEISWQGVNSRILSAKRPTLSTKGFQKLTLDRR
jgi:predicted CoA-binding protein